MIAKVSKKDFQKTYESRWKKMEHTSRKAIVNEVLEENYIN